MKIICSKAELMKSINIVMKAVPSKTTMPILECILMDATTNQIKFTTNDMELGIETIVDGQIEEKGMVALDAKIFYEIIRRLPDNDVTEFHIIGCKFNLICCCIHKDTFENRHCSLRRNSFQRYIYAF